MTGYQINPLTALAKSAGRIILCLLVIGVVAAILVPVSQSKLGNGRPGPGYIALSKAQKEGFRDPSEEAIAADDLPKVQSLLRRFDSWAGYFEDQQMRFDIAQYFVHKGLIAEAHKQLDVILHPTRRRKLTTVQTDAEFMSLWYATAVGIPQQEKDRQLHNWAFSLTKPQAPEISELSGLAKVEYLAGEECLDRRAPNQAISHFEQAMKADPNSSVLKAVLASTKKKV